MSKHSTHNLTIVKIGNAVAALPKVFDLMPSTNYQALISHSSNTLQRKAWKATGVQMRDAIDSVERNVRRKLA